VLSREETNTNISLWYNPTRARTNDLPHLRPAASVSLHYENPTQRVVLEQSGPHHHLVETWKIAKLALDNNHSLTLLLPLLLVVFNVVCLAEKKQIQISVFGITRPGLEPMIYRTRGQHANHYATDAGFYW
jgi:hypothetical protein